MWRDLSVVQLTARGVVAASPLAQENTTDRSHPDPAMAGRGARARWEAAFDWFTAALFASSPEAVSYSKIQDCCPFAAPTS